MNYWPILLSTLLLIISIVLYILKLYKNKSHYDFIIIGFVVVSLLIFLFKYTDRLTDTLIGFVIILLYFMLVYIPCYMIKHNVKYYEIVFIITHIMALILMTTIRSIILIKNPYYYLSLFISFSLIYLFKNNKDFIRAGVIFAFIIVLKVSIPVGIEIPFNIVTETDGFIVIVDSKPMRLAKDYFDDHYQNKRNYDITSVYIKDEVFILFNNQLERKTFRLVYKDQEIYEP